MPLNNCSKMESGRIIVFCTGNDSSNSQYYISVVLLAVADANYTFMYIDLGAIGKAADSTIFQDSTFGKALHVGSLNIPYPGTVTNALGPLSNVFVADKAFGISVNVMRPYPGNRLTDSQGIFNYRLSTAQRFLECAFGISNEQVEDVTSSNEFKIYKLCGCN
ncbi:hypothetical protein PR048_020102 [Dryococelus australis]|uniref:DDE Tnp4 domain-containing protein n=1 Tax=Dryococelus australis TaxID=614101 RepID=A0ABQ9H5C6_9NEOP|nr:hypothetical protein PR048_020102 [Dryococelus australis]